MPLAATSNSPVSSRFGVDESSQEEEELSIT